MLRLTLLIQNCDYAEVGILPRWNTNFLSRRDCFLTNFRLKIAEVFVSAQALKASPSLNSIIFCASNHYLHSNLWLCRSWYSTSIEYQLFIATGLLFNQFQVENGRSFRVRSSLESVPELKLDYFLRFESLSSFKFVIMQKLVFYLDRIPTFYRDGIAF